MRLNFYKSAERLPFLYSCKWGWIDLGHFWASAAAAYRFGASKTYLGGIAVEVIQFLTPPIGSLEGWTKSAFTVEDLPSDALGAMFGQSLQGKPYTAIVPAFTKLIQAVGVIDIAKADPRVVDLIKAEAGKLRENTTRNITVFPFPTFGDLQDKLRDAGVCCD